MLFPFLGRLLTTVQSDANPLKVLFPLFVFLTATLCTGEGAGRVTLGDEFSNSGFSVLPDRADFSVLLVCEEPADFASTSIFPRRVTREFLRALDVSKVGGGERPDNRNGVGDRALFAPSGERDALRTTIELCSGDGDGVGIPKSEKSVPKISLTSDDKRSLP